MITLETGRLLIRNFSPDDWPALQALAVAYRAHPFAQYEDPWPTSDAEVQGMARWFAGGDGYLASCLKAGGQATGPARGRVIALVAIERREGQPGAVHNLGYVFHPAYHGQGYATEACRAALRYLFEQAGAESILTGTNPANTASVRLLRRLGLTELGNGEWSLSREQWLAAQRQGAA
jgi:[ribosomal protein S5]-alanine N-acetyltransferase